METNTERKRALKYNCFILLQNYSNHRGVPAHVSTWPSVGRGGFLFSTVRFILLSNLKPHLTTAHRLVTSFLRRKRILYGRVLLEKFAVPCAAGEKIMIFCVKRYDESYTAREVPEVTVCSGCGEIFFLNKSFG